MEPRIGIVYITSRGIEIEMDMDTEEFKELAKQVGARITWLNDELKVMVVDDARVVFKVLPTTPEMLDEYCARR